MCEKYVPKVGEVCEVQITATGYVPVCINYCSEQLVVYEHCNCSKETALPLKNLVFRKLQTEEEKFVEAYRTLQSSPHTLAVFREWPSELYKAGFRYVGADK